MKLALQFLILPALLFTASAALSAPHIHKEAFYRDLWCQVNHGDTEQRQPNGTIADCVTGTYAVEVEFAEKWQEAVGQSLNYSNQTEKKAGILLILETDADLKYWRHLKELVDTLDKKGVSIQLWRIGPDEIEHTQKPPTGAIFIPHRCPKCFESVTLIQPQYKGGAFKGPAKGQCMNCMDEQEYDLTVPVNSEGLQNTKKSNGNKQRDCYKLLSNNE